MRQLIDDGLIRGWGISQVERDVEQAVIPYCLEHNIGVVPFTEFQELEEALNPKLGLSTNELSVDMNGVKKRAETYVSL